MGKCDALARLVFRLIAEAPGVLPAARTFVRQEQGQAVI
jgi:hypothetical protein